MSKASTEAAAAMTELQDAERVATIALRRAMQAPTDQADFEAAQYAAARGRVYYAIRAFNEAQDRLRMEREVERFQRDVPSGPQKVS